jgi:hypothetical protein
MPTYYKHIYTLCIISVSLFPSSRYKVKRTDYYTVYLINDRRQTNFCIFITRKDNDYRKFVQYFFLIYDIKFSGNRTTALRQLLRFHCL